MIPFILKRYLRSALRKLFSDIPPLLVNEKVLNETYILREGTVKPKADYDDAWLYILSKDSDTIFDIGANIGQSAIICLSANPKCTLVLVEPNPAALTIAAENLIRNNHSQKSTFICKFVSDANNQDVDFYTVAEGAAGSMYPLHAVTAAKKNKHYFVKTTTIDYLCENFGFPDLIKIDIEGAEYLALKGAERCFIKGKSIFLVEMHSNPEMSMVVNAKNVLQHCQKFNYRIWYLSEKTWLTEPEMVKDRGRCHFLLIPKNKPLLSRLANITQGEAISN